MQTVVLFAESIDIGLSMGLDDVSVAQYFYLSGGWGAWLRHRHHVGSCSQKIRSVAPTWPPHLGRI